MELEEPGLKEINLFPTYKCNLRCEMCDLWSEPNDNDLSLDEIKLMLNEAKQIGAHRLKIGGGEPLINNDLFLLLEFAHNLNYYIEITTNGTLINENVAKRLVGHINTVNISIEGAKECHDSIRGKGTFLLAKNAARLLRKNSRRLHIILIMVVSKISYKYMRYLVELAQELNANAISYQPFFKGTLDKRFSLRNKFIIQQEDTLALSAEIDNTLLYAESKKVSIDNKKTKNILEYFANSGKFYPAPYCRNPLDSLLIQPSGDVWPCAYMDKVGNIREKSLKSLWYGSLFRDARTKAQNKACLGCFCYTEPESNDIINKKNFIRKLLRFYKNN